MATLIVTLADTPQHAPGARLKSPGSLPPAMNTATRSVEFKDAGVASAMVNTMQQIGGSIGIALLSAFAAQRTSSYLCGALMPALASDGRAG